MDAGKLDTRVEIKTLTKTSDGFGGFTATASVSATVWAYVKEVKGDVQSNEYTRGRYLNVDIVLRDKTFDENNINESTILKVQSKDGDYRITGIYEGFKNKFVKISATKRD
jgi:head-tail adaptor